jgi:hypothetical protein
MRDSTFSFPELRDNLAAKLEPTAAEGIIGLREAVRCHFPPGSLPVAACRRPAKPELAASWSS